MTQFYVFARITYLNCIVNKNEFVFVEELSNWIVEQYFDGLSCIKKTRLVCSSLWQSKREGHDDDVLKFVILYFIHTFVLSNVDTVVIPHLHFDLVESGIYKDYPRSSLSFEDLAKSINKKLKSKEKFYLLQRMPLAIQVWLYEFHSNIPQKIASKVDS